MKLVQLDGFIIRIYDDAHWPERQTQMHISIMCPVHVHHQKTLQNGYNNVQERYKKIPTILYYLLYMSEKKKVNVF